MIPVPTTMDEWKTAAELLEALATTLGLLIAAVWTYLVFVRKRQRYPRAKLRIQATLKPVREGLDLLHVVVFVDNMGDVLLQLIGANARVDEVLPLRGEIAIQLATQPSALRRPGETEIRWPALDRCDPKWEKDPYEVEPGESENIHFDFLIPSTAHTVEVYAHFQNVSKRGRDIGWDITALYDVTSSPKGRALRLLAGA
jgi:hypothetical protein